MIVCCGPRARAARAAEWCESIFDSEPNVLLRFRQMHLIARHSHVVFAHCSACSECKLTVDGEPRMEPYRTPQSYVYHVLHNGTQQTWRNVYSLLLQYATSNLVNQNQSNSTSIPKDPQTYSAQHAIAISLLAN